MALSWTSLHHTVSKLLRTLGWGCCGKDVQDEGSVGRDEAREATVTVGVVAGDKESGLLAEGHAAVGLNDALVPTCGMLVMIALADTGEVLDCIA